MAEPRRRRMRRGADSLTCSLVLMSERRAGQRTEGQTRCRSHHKDSLPHRLAPFLNDTYRNEAKSLLRSGRRFNATKV